LALPQSAVSDGTMPPNAAVILLDIVRLPLFACLGLLAVTPTSGQVQFLSPKANWAAPPPVTSAHTTGNTYLVSNTTGYGITAIKRDLSNNIALTFSFAPQQAITPGACGRLAR
jgi:hypothetical protein